MSFDKLSYAVQLAKAGNKAEALPLLKEIVRTDPDNETAWLWLHACIEQNEQKIYCLQQALRINPYNQGAQRALEKLTLQNPAQPHLFEKPAVQKMTSGKQKPSGEYDSGDSPPTKQKKNTILIGALILLSLCVICCIGSWIYIKVSPPIPTRTPTRLPPSRTPRPTETPKPTLPPDLIITYDNVCVAPDDTEVTIEGYLYFRGSTELMGGEYKIALSKEPEEWDFDHPYDAQVFLFIKEGFGPNQMRELPKYRRESDLKIYTDGVKVLRHGDPVEVTGNMWIHYAADAGGGCGIRVTKIVAK
jgi:hypothetical protein